MITDTMLLDCINDIESNDTNIWINSKFSKIRLLPLTARGDVGELLFQRYCDDSKQDYVCWTTFTNPELVPAHHSFDALITLQSVYDLLYQYDMLEQEDSYVKIEIKTATLSTNNTFQFNNIRDDGWEYIVLFGIYPNDIAFRILSRNETYNMNLCEMASTAYGNQKLTVRSEDMLNIQCIDDVFDETIGEQAMLIEERFIEQWEL